MTLLIDDLLDELSQRVERNDLEAALAACRRLNGRLSTDHIPDPEQLRRARTRIDALGDLLCAVRRDLQADLQAARRRRCGVAAYQRQA